MKRSLVFLLVVAPGLLLAQQAPLVPVVPLAQRIAHADPAKYRHIPAVHAGPGAREDSRLPVRASVASISKT